MTTNNYVEELVQNTLAEIKSLMPREDSDTKLTDWWEFDRKASAVITDAIEQGKREAWEEAIKLSDEIELVEPDAGTRQWMAFKRFRNTLRDYLSALTPTISSKETTGN